MNRSSKTSTIGEWSTTVAKIGLMYASDYTLSLGSGALSMTGGTNTNRDTLKTGWMHQSNNDTSVFSNEWTLSRGGDFDGEFFALNMYYGGFVDNDYVSDTYDVRPVLYLTSDVEKLSGKGTYTEPYMLRETNENKLKVSTSLSDTTMTASITKGDYDLNKYCINNSTSITGCTWNKVTSETITTEVEEGRTYIHVIDKGGYLVRSSVYYKNYTFAEELILSSKLWHSGLEGDGYRYIGSGAYNSATTPSNFICFGTSDKTECKNNEAKYLYRIIGVFEGSDGKQHLKLIKFKQLSSTYAWKTYDTYDADWANSDVYYFLNGEYFLTSTTYDYMKDETWLNKIEDWTWSAVNTLTNESSGLDYSTITPREIYLHEMNRSSKTNTIGEWTTPVAKIGLMYVSDYILSLGSSALSITGSISDNSSTLRTGWMHQINNDTTSSTAEWTMSKYGWYSPDGPCEAYLINNPLISTVSTVLFSEASNEFAVRPVFHLTSDVTPKSGSGTYSDPYIIN